MLAFLLTRNRSAEPSLALRSSHPLPARGYLLSHAANSPNLLVSMAHRNVHVYDLATLAAASEGTEVKPTQERESALKFLTRSIGCMADGKGESIESRSSSRFGSVTVYHTRGFVYAACMSRTADVAGWASGSIEGRIAVEYFDPSPEVQAGKYAFRSHRQPIDGVDHVYPINAIAYHPM